MHLTIVLASEHFRWDAVVHYPGAAQDFAADLLILSAHICVKVTLKLCFKMESPTILFD
jgi:hypothetical protein